MYEGREDLSELPEEAEGLEGEGADGGDEPQDESVRETVERVVREAQTATDGADGGEKAPEEGQEPVEKAVKRKLGRPKKEAAAVAEPPAETGFQIPAPQRLTLQQKEAFNALPDALKRATHEMFRAQEAQFTQAVQKARAAQTEASGVLEAVRPYLNAHPELLEKGFTESRLVGSLIAAHQRLTDPKTARQAFIELGQQLGIDPAALEAIRGDAPAGPVDISQHPQVVALSEEVKRLKSIYEGNQAQQLEAATQSVAAEFESVRNETTPDGRYLYPELHDGRFLEQAKPLVFAFVRAIPNLGYGEALKRACLQLRESTGNSHTGSQARFPAQSTNIERAQRAAVSVRGRSAPISGAPSGEIPQEALGSARDTVRWALQQMRRGA